MEINLAMLRNTLETTRSRRQEPESRLAPAGNEGLRRTPRTHPDSSPRALRRAISTKTSIFCRKDYLRARQAGKELVLDGSGVRSWLSERRSAPI